MARRDRSATSFYPLRQGIDSMPRPSDVDGAMHVTTAPTGTTRFDPIAFGTFQTGCAVADHRPARLARPKAR